MNLLAGKVTFTTSVMVAVHTVEGGGCFYLTPEWNELRPGAHLSIKTSVTVDDGLLFGDGFINSVTAWMSSEISLLYTELFCPQFASKGTQRGVPQAD